MKQTIGCKICGKGFTTLKKHLAISHNLSPKDYRKKFKIPMREPLVSEAYADAKRRISEKLGLKAKN